MNFIKKKDGLTRLLSTLHCDYEMVVNDFMKQSGLHFTDFAEVAKRSQITLLYHAAVGQSKNRMKYHTEVGSIILNAAKDFWLYPGILPNPRTDPDEEGESHLPTAAQAPSKRSMRSESVDSVSTQDLAVFNEDQSKDDDCLKRSFIDAGDDQEMMDLVLKKQICGFYLTYLMYFRQPYMNLLKIKMDPKDDDASELFFSQLSNVNRDLAEEIRFMFIRLRINHAFEITGFADWHNVDPTTRGFLNCKKNKILELAKMDRQVQDSITYGQVVADAPDNFHNYLVAKKQFSDKACFKEMPADMQMQMDLEGSEVTNGTKVMKEIAICDTSGKNECQELGQSPSPSVEFGKENGTNGNGAIASRDTSMPCSSRDFTHAATDMAVLNTDLIHAMQAVNGTGEIIETASSLQLMADHPRQNPAAILGNPMIDRVLNQEAHRRLTRVLEIQNKKANPEAAKPKNPYKKEGGLFGKEEVERKTPRRYKAAFSLWKYIQGDKYEDDDPASYKYKPSENGGNNAEPKP